MPTTSLSQGSAPSHILYERSKLNRGCVTLFQHFIQKPMETSFYYECALVQFSSLHAQSNKHKLHGCLTKSVKVFQNIPKIFNILYPSSAYHTANLDSKIQVKLLEAQEQIIISNILTILKDDNVPMKLVCSLSHKKD